MQVKGCQEIIAVPKKDLAIIPGTDKKQLACIPDLSIVLVPGNECKQLAAVPKKEIAIVPTPKLDVCLYFYWN